MDLKGFKQVLRSEYNSTSPEDRKGYLWFVRENANPIEGVLRPTFVNSGIIQAYKNLCASVFYESIGRYEIVLYGAQNGVDLDLQINSYDMVYKWYSEDKCHKLCRPSGEVMYAYMIVPKLSNSGTSWCNCIGYEFNGYNSFTSKIDDDLLRSLSVDTSYFPTSVYLGNRLYSTDPKINDLFIQRQMMKFDNMLMNTGLSSNGLAGVSIGSEFGPYSFYSGLLSHDLIAPAQDVFYRQFFYGDSFNAGYSFLNAVLNLKYSSLSYPISSGVNSALVNLQNWADEANGGYVPETLFRDLASLYRLTIPYNKGSGITNCFDWIYEQVRELVASSESNITKIQ